jgi:hypothetical protein
VDVWPVGIGIVQVPTAWSPSKLAHGLLSMHPWLQPESVYLLSTHRSMSIQFDTLFFHP